MDTVNFDRLARLFDRLGTRRAALRALLGTTALGTARETAMAKGKPKTKGKHRGKGRRQGSGGHSTQAKPDRTVSNISDDFTSDACGFLVQVHVEGQEIALDFGDRLIFTYTGTSATLVNSQTGTALRVAVPGPKFVQFSPDGTVSVRGAGPWLFVPRHPETLEAGIWLVRGLSLRTFVDRQLIDIEIHGRSDNLCAALA
jgi:hypothetical protein